MNNKDLGLNEFLQPINSPITGAGATDGYKFDYETERNAVRSMQIQDAAITNAKIGTAAIGTANIGTLSFNEISGGTARLGGTLNGEGLFEVYNSAGTQISQLDKDGLQFFGQFPAVNFKTITGGTILADIEVFGASNFRMNTYQNYNMWFTADNSMFLDSTDAMILESGSSNVSLIAAGSVKLKSAGSANVFQIWSGTAAEAYTDIKVDDNSGTTRVTYGTTTAKTAIVPTSKGYNALYCAESPEVWFMDFAKIKPKKWYEFFKKDEYIIDPLFLETIEKVNHITPTASKNIVQVWGIRKGFKGIRFESKTEKEFKKNSEFWKH